VTETPPGVTAPYADPDDVRLALGPLGGRLPVGFDVDRHLRRAHAEVLDELGTVYRAGVPTFTGDGAEAARFAEANVAAANILDALRAHLGDVSQLATDLRAAAARTVTGGVPGFPVDAGPTVPGTTSRPAVPQVSHVARVSVFGDPYAHLVPYVDPIFDAPPAPVDGATVVVDPFQPDVAIITP
jgi:hypothetical protein